MTERIRKMDIHEALYTTRMRRLLSDPIPLDT